MSIKLRVLKPEMSARIAGIQLTAHSLKLDHLHFIMLTEFARSSLHISYNEKV